MIAVDVGIDEQERLVAEEVARIGDAPGGFERLRLLRPGDCQAPVRAVAQNLDDQATQMRHVDHDVPEASCGEVFKMPDDQRLSAHFDERLGQRVGDGPQALAAPGGQDHYFHQNV